MEILNVALGERSYSIYIGKGILHRLGGILRDLSPGEKVLVVTDPTAGYHYTEQVLSSLRQAGKKAYAATIDGGEECKTLATVSYLYDRAVELGLDRKSAWVALGGGVVGDITGLAAATYMRGAPFFQVPTTLLAQVDSSVGGKVAVNHPKGKNMIGAFYQPIGVLADVALLNTLAQREIRSGLAEVIKYGVIMSGEFFTWLEDNMDRILAGDATALIHIVEQSCRIKALVVEEDERENGRRAILNYGHTIGHAIESLWGYGRYTHGEGVSIGMVAAAELAVSLGIFPAAGLMRIVELLRRVGLPVAIPPQTAPESLIDSLLRDKKTVDGQLTFILPADIGAVVINNSLSPELVKENILVR